jgi:hypothetical protein
VEQKVNKPKLDNLYDNLYDTPTHLIEEIYDKGLMENNLNDVKNKNISKTPDTDVVPFIQVLSENEKLRDALQGRRVTIFLLFSYKYLMCLKQILKVSKKPLTSL